MTIKWIRVEKDGDEVHYRSVRRSKECYEVEARSSAKNCAKISRVGLASKLPNEPHLTHSRCNNAISTQFPSPSPYALRNQDGRPPPYQRAFKRHFGTHVRLHIRKTSPPTPANTKARRATQNMYVSMPPPTLPPTHPAKRRDN